VIGHRVIRLESVDSTNTYAVGLAKDPGAHGTVVVADVQTAGRGQYGRSWISEPGESLLGSVLVIPPRGLNRPVVLIAWAAIALSDAIHALTGRQARIKWPNDLVIDGKKICGILTEAANDAVVVGIGLNVTQTQNDFDERNLPDATSLSLTSGQTFDRDGILGTVLRHLDQEWERIAFGEFERAEAEWKWRIGLLGRAVAAERYDGLKIIGRLMDMGFDGIEIATDTGGIDVLAPESIRGLRAL
jgi:BirA family biotin operon repressor/biotin-[acetyl-CoA-carboxylase] ligase